MSPDARRRQLIQAALATFAARGIGETNHTALALEAGVAVPTVFHYFSTKDDVIDAVLKEVSRFLLDDLLAENDQPDVAAPTAVEQVLMSFCDAIDTHGHYIRVWLEWSVSIRDGLWPSYLEFYSSARSGIRKILERGIAESSIRYDIEIDDAARVIVALAHMIVQMKFSGSSREQIVQTVHTLLGSYLQSPKEG
ncbi:MAG: TetR/AcrR family hemagglutinin/protease transcriptional regulator [Gammaproteobacteria bacterium]|jgi:TetR/AcrR family hemagglutinin/protease transcriptional regulator